MDKFHVYETLGKGKHSTVYKARRKKTIQYYAIKSVDKGQEARVLREVEIMHELRHTHVLKFHKWYKTSNHLWLVLEYCVGGDLLTLLRKDQRLPETSVHDFARGLVSSLQYCHSQGVIYGDLKPSNLLLDENGRIKLGGFGLSKKLKDINPGPAQPQGQGRSGTPVYMAPELFREGGVPSSASDLWALGCVLYECAAGRPPFVASLLSRLVEDILTVEPPPLPGASPEFTDLVFRLLDKNPATRLAWAHLRGHSFWKKALPQLPLPTEPALQAFIERHHLCPSSGPLPFLSVKGHKRRLSDAPNINALRVSRIVRSNLEAEAGGATEYGAASAGTGTADVKLHTPDAELDFDERASDAGGSECGDDSAATAALVDDSAVEGLDREPGADGAEHAQLLAGMARVSFAGSPAQMPAPRRSPAPMQPPPQPPAAITPTAHSPLAAAWGNIPTTPPPASSAADPSSAEALIWHASDSRITPIVGNSRVEKLAQPKFDERTLPVAPWDAAALLSAPQPELEAFLTAIYQALGSAAPVKDKTNVLAYIEGQLCCNTDVANMFINSNISGLLVRMLRGASASNGSREKDSLKARLAGVLGLLLRHATYIADSLSSTGIVEVLTLAVGASSERVQRRAMAALGELLFYIATQAADSAAAEAPADGTAGAWHIPGSTINLVSHRLEPGVDEITQHYAARTVENVVTQGGAWAARFADNVTATNLVSLWGTAKNEALRAAAASALARLLRHAPEQLAMLVRKFRTNMLVQGLADPSPKVQTAAVNLLSSALASAELGPFTRECLQKAPGGERAVLSATLELLVHPQPALRAKGCIATALLLRESPSNLAAACNAGLPPAADRLHREKDACIAAALAALRAEIAAVMPSISEQLSRVLANGSVATRLRASAWDVGGPAANFAAAVPPLLGSAALHPAAASDALVTALAAALSATVAVPLSDEFAVQVKAEVLAAVEALFGSGWEGIAGHVQTVITTLTPALAAAAADAVDADTRFQALKLLLDLLLILLASGEGGRRLAGELEAVVQARLLPAVGRLLGDEAPLPLFTLKLLAALLEARPAWSAAVTRLGLVPRFIDFLSLQHPNNNVHNLRVARLLIAGGALPPAQLEALDVPNRVASVLAYTHGNRVAPFLEPVLELCWALLTAYRPTINGRPSPFGAEAAHGAAEVAQGLLPALPVFVELGGTDEAVPAALAAQCAAAVAQMSPHDSSEILLNREGASLVAAALAGAPSGPAGEAARRHTLATISTISAAARASGSADQGAVRQLRAAIMNFPLNSSPELQAVAADALRCLAALG